MARDEAEGRPQELRVALDWGDVSSLPVIPLNQFVCQVGAPLRDGRPDGIYLLFGNVAPPLIIGETPEERQQFIDMAKAGARIQVHGRYILSRERLNELIDALQKIADIHDMAIETAKAQAGN